MRTLITHVGLLLLCGLAACSSGSSSDRNPAQTQGVHIVVDTSASTDTMLTGLVAAVALERPDGSVDTHEFKSPVELVLAHPLGISSGLALHAAGRGPIVAVYLRMVPGSLRARMPNGEEATVDTPASIITVKLKTNGGSKWIVVRHAATLQMKRGNSGKMRWQATMVGTADGTHELKDARFEIVSTDPEKGTAMGVLQRCADLTLDLDFPKTAKLTRESADGFLTPKQFLEGLSKGDVITVDGVLSKDEGVEVMAAHHNDEPKGKGRKSKVLGRITELLTKDMDFKLDVTEVRVGGSGLPKDRPLVLTVQADDAKIKWVPRHARHRAHLPFDALQKDMIVEVEWHGEAKDLTVTADKINIKAEAKKALVREFDGTVSKVDVKNGKLSVKAGEEGFVIEGVRYDTLEVTIDKDTVVMRRGLSGLSEVKVGDTVWVLGALMEENNLRARLIRIGSN